MLGIVTDMNALEPRRISTSGRFRWTSTGMQAMQHSRRPHAVRTRHIKHQVTTVNASHPAEHALCDTRRLATQNHEGHKIGERP